MKSSTNTIYFKKTLMYISLKANAKSTIDDYAKDGRQEEVSPLFGF